MIRLMKPRDSDALFEMLEAEGIEPHRMTYDIFPTCCLVENGEVIGFVTMRTEHGFPSVQHFCVKRGKRNAARARQLARHTLWWADGTFIMHVRKGQDRVKRLLEAYWDATPYGDTEDKHWYIVRGIR